MVRIIIPAYNEAANLPTVCAAIAHHLAHPYQLYVVDDGSRDQTAGVSTQLATTYPLRLLTHPSNRGVAEAFRTGFTAALADSDDRDVIVVMEGDATSDARLLPSIVRKLESGRDLVIASRYRPGGGYKNFPLKRWVLSQGANRILRLLFPIAGVTDYSIFYRGHRVPPLRKAWARYGRQMITAEAFFANCEILIKLRPYVQRVEEVPLLYDYSRKRGQSGMNIGRNLRAYLTFILRSLYTRDGAPQIRAGTYDDAPGGRTSRTRKPPPPE